MSCLRMGERGGVGGDLSRAIGLGLRDSVVFLWFFCLSVSPCLVFHGRDAGHRVQSERSHIVTLVTFEVHSVVLCSVC